MAKCDLRIFDEMSCVCENVSRQRPRPAAVPLRRGGVRRPALRRRLRQPQGAGASISTLKAGTVERLKLGWNLDVECTSKPSPHRALTLLLSTRGSWLTDMKLPPWST